MTPKHGHAIRMARAAIIAILLAVAVLLPTKTPKGRAIWLYINGSASICTFMQSLEAADITLAQIAATSQMHRTMTLIAKDENGFTYWDTQRGRFWMASGSRDALEYDLAEQERGIYGRGDRGAQSGDIVLDCGANVGVYAKTALASGASLVVAIEPGPENLECLRRNLAAEIGARKVIVVAKGVWDKDDILTLNSDPHNSARNSLHQLNGPDIRQVKVSLTTIDKLVTELRLPRVDFIKLDIEGAERHAILGARETIKTFKPRMAICTYHLSSDPTEIPNEVRSIEPTYKVTMQGLMTEDQIIAEVAHFASPRRE